MQEDFDKTTLSHIFNYLDISSLLAITEVCSYFNDTVQKSRKLMSKLKLVMRFEDIRDDRHCNKVLLNEFQKFITRDYQSVQFLFLKENSLSNSMRKQLFSIIDKLKVESIRSLQINSCYLGRDDVFNLLKKFPNLVELTIEQLMFSNDFSPSELALEGDSERLSLPNLRSFHLIHADFFCLLLINSCTQLHTLEILSPSYNRTDIEELENFLLKQRHLKKLSMSGFRFNSSYSTNRLAKVLFQLEVLKLKDITWDITEHASLFLKTQKNLKHFKLSKFQRWITPREQNLLLFNDLMKHILISNTRMESVEFNERYSFSYLKNTDFLVGECNRNVKKLTYARCMSSTNSELLMAFTRLFPNLTSLELTTINTDVENILQAVQSFPGLQEISITSNTAALQFLPKESIKNIKKFEFSALGEPKAFEIIKSILIHNSQIEQISLNIEPLTVEEIIELVISFSATLKSIAFHNFYFNLTELEMLLTNFACLRHLSSDVKPSREVMKALASSQISFTLIE